MKKDLKILIVRLILIFAIMLVSMQMLGGISLSAIMYGLDSAFQWAVIIVVVFALHYLYKNKLLKK